MNEAEAKLAKVEALLEEWEARAEQLSVVTCAIIRNLVVEMRKEMELS